MKNSRYFNVAVAGLVLVFIMLSLTACMYIEGPPRVVRRGPPSHAKAHGYRARHMYRYYPGAQIYFDVKRNVYFFMSGGVWTMAASLPVAFRVNLGPFVTMELETDKPYKKHQAHKQKYPPGKYRRKKRNYEKKKRERERRKEKEKREIEREKEKEKREREREKEKEKKDKEKEEKEEKEKKEKEKKKDKKDKGKNRD